MAVNLQGQIKIGENPQTLDPASVLELESTSRALVITRLTDTQMNNITPLRGALVYNTDEDCIHYYDGTQWVNICEALDNSFTTTTEAIFNTASLDNTVVVTQVNDNYNFEVNQITGDNIVDTSILGGDIGVETIGTGNLANKSITLEKLLDGNLAGELLRWNGTDWEIINESSLNIIEADGVIGNEVTGPADGTLQLSGIGDDTSPFLLGVSPNGITNTELANNAVTSNNILDGEVGTNDIANDAITEDKIATATPDSFLLTDGAGNPQWVDGLTVVTSLVDGVTLEVNPSAQVQIRDDGVTNAKLANNAVNTAEIVDNAITINKIGTAGLADANRILGTDAAGDPQWQDASSVAANLGEDVVSTNGSITGVQADAALVAMDLEVNVDGTTIEVDATNGVQIADDGVNTDKIGTAGLADANRILGTDAAGDPQWQDASSVAANLGEDVVSTDGSITGVQADAALVAMDLEVNVDGTTIEVDATNGVQIADNGVTTDKIGTAGLADANRILGTDAAGDPQWQDASSVAANLGEDVVSTNGSITGVQADAALVVMDLEVNVDGTTIEVDATNGVQIADNGVTTDKIGTAGLADANRILGTDAAGDPQWQDASSVSANLGEDVVSTNGSITGVQADAALVAMDLEVNVDGTTIEVDAINGVQIADDGVNTDKIGTAGLADANRILGTDAAGDPQWQDASSVAANLGEDVVSTDGSITGVQADAALVAMDLEVNVDGTTIEVDATNGVQIADNGVTTDKIGTAGLADANRILGTDAAGDPQWQDASSVAANLGEDVVSTNGSITGVQADAALVAMDLEVNVDGTTIEVDATNGVQIADDGVTTDKIANGNVTRAKIANGTAAGQLMQWNGTDWVLVDDSTLDVVDEIVLKGQVSAAAGTSGAYTINDPAITATSIIQLTVEENTPGNPIMIQLTNQVAGTFEVQIYEFTAGPTAFTGTNANWQYIVVAP